MNTIIRLGAVLVLAALPTVTVADEAPSDFVQMGAYVTSDNMTESEAFYAALLGVEPVIKLENFIAFDVAGGIFAIANREVYAPDSSAGTCAIPYIHSPDLSAIQARFEKVTG